MATFRNPSFQRLVEGTLKRTAAALADADVPFCLIGSLSAWVRGGPESSHDLDLGIREEDVLRAAEVLEADGMYIQVVAEPWLIKAWSGEPDHPDSHLVDLIYAPSGCPITDEVLARADVMDVLAMPMRVLCPTDLMVMKLTALREQHLNLTSSIATARAVREQINWDELRERTHHSPYALGFFTMCEGLGICPPVGESQVRIMADMQLGEIRGSDPATSPRRQLIERLRD